MKGRFSRISREVRERDDIAVWPAILKDDVCNYWTRIGARTYRVIYYQAKPVRMPELAQLSYRGTSQLWRPAKPALLEVYVRKPGYEERPRAPQDYLSYYKLEEDKDYYASWMYHTWELLDAIEGASPGQLHRLLNGGLIDLVMEHAL